MSDKIRCSSEQLKTATLVFASTDRVAGTFEWIAAQRMIAHFLDDVDVSVDTSGEICYEAERMMVTKRAGTAWVAGDRIFYSPGSNDFHKATSSVVDVVAGIALEAAASAATEALAHFQGGAGSRPQMEGSGT